MTELLFDVWQLRPVMDAFALSLGRPSALTAAGWQLVSALGGEQLTVPELARRLGRRRQSVQVAVDDLIAEGYATKAPNARRARSPFIQLTTSGSDAFWTTAQRQIAWSNEAAVMFRRDDLISATAVLRELREILDESVVSR